MTGRSDITRWNRAGLRRFRYVDANAASYLEELRARLAERFPIWQAIQRAGSEPASNAELTEQYLAPRSAIPDWGWEIARALARACHVLGGHVDAFANESYLATATQWESLRRLVALVDYHPAPPASAFTHLALSAKPDASGTVPPGFAVSAESPGARITFETTEVLAIDSVLNELRPDGFDRNPEVLSGSQLELDGQVQDLAIGDPLVIQSETDGATWARRITGVAVGAATTVVQLSPNLPANVLVRGRVVVHAGPRDRLDALGPSKASATLASDIVLVRGAAGIVIGDVVTLVDQVHRSYHKVTAITGQRLTLDRAIGELRFDSASISPVVSVDAEVRTGPTGTFTVAIAGNWERLRDQVVADPRAFSTTSLPLRYTVSSADYTPATPPPSVAADGGKTVLTDPSGNKATITGGDEQYSNGVVHHVDAVLLPGKAGNAPAVGDKAGK